MLVSCPAGAETFTLRLGVICALPPCQKSVTILCVKGLFYAPRGKPESEVSCRPHRLFAHFSWSWRCPWACPLRLRPFLPTCKRLTLNPAIPRQFFNTANRPSPTATWMPRRPHFARSCSWILDQL